ncbi:MAG: alpha/beta hydrolase [Xenococcaceae cyanobacterium]
MKRRKVDKDLKNLTRPNQFVFGRWVSSLALVIIPVTATPVDAAERIYFNYGPLGFSVAVDSLETFAKEGTINKELGFYLPKLSEEDQAKFRKALLKRYDIKPIQLYRIFHTPMGKEILTIIGNFINIQGGRNGFYGIRGAMVQAAADPEGLTILNFMRKFPTNIQLNTDEILEETEQIKTLVKATKMIVEEMARLSAAEAAAEAPVNFSALPDIRRPGEFDVDKQTLTLIDESRDRKFQVDLYKPQRWRSGTTPVVVISHGLASSPKNFERYAGHLASYGYVVVVPQHPGSDFSQLQAMLEGYSREIFKLNEFIDRPLDVSYLLDELEQRNQFEFQGRLNLEAVGVMGHSFGGYTALALAGAQIDFEQLAKDCILKLRDPNLSLLVQCRALELPRQDYNFRDNRVKAVFPVKPMNSSIFGPKGLSWIQIPVLLGASNQDLFTPVVLEQVRSFSWLTTPNKYLALVKGDTHFNLSELDSGIFELLESFPPLTIRDRRMIESHSNYLLLAFFEVYIANNAEYRPYLQSSYTEYISKEPFNLYLIGSSSVDELTHVWNRIVPAN